MKTPNPERLVFAGDHEAYARNAAAGIAQKQYVRDLRGWCLFGPQDVRGHSRKYQFTLQKLPSQKLPRVRVGCRYFDLKQAWKHWDVNGKRNRYTTRRNECRQAIAIIQLMIHQAQAYGLMPLYTKPIKFDSTIIKPKKRK